VKLIANIKEIKTIEGEPTVGGLVRSSLDEKATGIIVQILSKDEVFVLWSTPPQNIIKRFGEIW
jgi:hypothetical protein